MEGSRKEPMKGKIRRAEEKDTDRVLELLSQVLMVHHRGRPDIFKADATKYSREELAGMFRDDENPVFVFSATLEGKP